MDKLEMWAKEFAQMATDADDELADYFTAGANDMRSLIAERDQLRAEKKEFAQEAVRWAEEAGRLKALLHDAQADATRYRWLREWRLPEASKSQPAAWIAGAGNKFIESDWLTGTQADSAIDAAMAAEREWQG